jgi:RNA polymerase sigma-70 factor (sigma-E family)
MMAVVTSEVGLLTAIYREQYRSLVKLAAILVDDRSRCEEIVQDAFVSVFRSAGRLRDPARLPAYLRSAVLNGARSDLRKQQVRARLTLVGGDDVASAETSAVASDEQRAVLQALRALPARQRDVLMLRFYLDLSESEIATTLGIAPGTVKTHVRRGMAALAETLEDRR